MLKLILNLAYYFFLLLYKLKLIIKKRIANELRNESFDLETVAMTKDKAVVIQKLYLTDAIRQVLDRKNELQIDEGLEYFMDKIMDLSNESYIPTLEDVMHVRIKSTGLKETQFPLRGQIYRIVDVGGQRNERKKWIHCFADVTLIIYVMALNDYDRVLEEDGKTNRLKESIQVFGQVLGNKYFAETPVVVFLNKKDLFATQIKTSNLTKCFPEYTGANEYEPCVEFIKEKFENTLRSLPNYNPKRQFFTYETCAIDTKSVDAVFNIIRRTFFEEMGI